MSSPAPAAVGAGGQRALRPRLFTRLWPVLAVAVLVLNDHLLKGAGVLPGWLTGKLSDFCGLFFAPLLLAELWLLALPARSAGSVVQRLWWSAGGVGAVFAAINLFAPASALYVKGVGTLVAFTGARIVNVVDPTDLLALPMLLLAVRYGASRAEGC